MTTGVLEIMADSLHAVGFRSLTMPLEIHGAEFLFDGAFVGTGVSQDLVLVGGLRVAPESLVGLLAGLNRVLDRSASRRPVSLVLLGPRPDAFTLRRLEERARVLTVNTAEPTPAELANALAVLLPLRLPSPTTLASDPVGQLRKRLGTRVSTVEEALISAIPDGPDGVREALQSQLAQPFTSAEPGGPDD